MRVSRDPTFALVAMLWHPLYSWDEALENLYGQICSLVPTFIHHSNLNFSHSDSAGGDCYEDPRYGFKQRTAHNSGTFIGKPTSV